MTRLPVLFLFFATCAANCFGQFAAKAAREKVAGIDVITYPTEVKDVVTFRGSLPAGDSFAPRENIAVPTLVGGMLDKGTTKQNKFEIAQKLENIGARIGFSVDGVMTQFHGKCLRKDLPVVIAVLAEELREPAFAEDEFAKLKKQLSGDLQRALESTDFRADQAFSASVFPLGHPNYNPPPQEFIAAIQAATLDDLRKFHAEFYGPAQATIVLVGDVDIPLLKSEIAKSFEGWTGGKTVGELPHAPRPDERKEQTISMADKPNVTVILGHASGLRYRDADALALRIGTAALGTGFTGRLMANVRDKQGLTYGISASLSGDAFTDGEWRISGNFAPQLLEKGLAATRHELEKWYANGITAAELERVKSYLVGSFKVGLTTTEGLASAILTAIHRGYDVSWLDEYPKRVAALSLQQVNDAIKRHVQPEKMTIIRAGSVSPPTDRG
jgi:zinc protease